LKALPGNHVDQASIRLNGVTIAPGERLRVEANNFIASGGDGFTVFGEGTDERDGGLDIDALVSYVRTHSPVPVTAPHRIIRRDAGGPQ
jgi:5'-nucleotidase